MILFDSNFNELGRQIQQSHLPGGHRSLQVQADRLNEKVVQEGWRASIPFGAVDRPALQNGIELVQEGAPVIVGISLENSYFSPQRLGRLFRVLNVFNAKVYIVPMDLPAEHSYRARGYSEKEIARKIKKKGAEIRRAVSSALDAVGVAPERTQVLGWEFIRESPQYKEAVSNVRSLREGESHFRDDLAQTVRQYIVRQMRAGEDVESVVETAQEYLIEELSFLLAAQEMLGEEKLCYMYHREWPIFERLVAGEYGPIPNSDLGFFELRIE